MAVDVRSEIEISCARAEVAAFACDPDNATAWYRNIKSVEMGVAASAGGREPDAFVAQFLGRRLAYTYQVMELERGERFVMATAEGPFAMETTYSWQDTADGATTMTLRNRGEPAGFAKVIAPVMAGAIRRANRSDLRRLKDLLERRRV